MSRQWPKVQEVAWVEDKLQEIVDIIPDLSGKIGRMKANIVLQLVDDTQASSKHHCWFNMVRQRVIASARMV